MYILDVIRIHGKRRTGQEKYWQWWEQGLEYWRGSRRESTEGRSWWWNTFVYQQCHRNLQIWYSDRHKIYPCHCPVQTWQSTPGVLWTVFLISSKCILS
jgi:hypothetical protein